MDDRDEGSTRIPIRIENGRPVFFYGEPFPRLREGAVGELIVARSSVHSPELIAALESEEERRLFEAGETLMIDVDAKETDSRLLDRSGVGQALEATGTGFAPVLLRAPLRILLRASKRALLRPCACSLTTLDLDAGSLNEAYSAASGLCERWRRSHTGNVFRKVFFDAGFAAGERLWQPLERLRFQLEVEFEHRVMAALGKRR